MDYQPEERCKKKSNVGFFFMNETRLLFVRIANELVTVFDGVRHSRSCYTLK